MSNMLTGVIIAKYLGVGLILHLTSEEYRIGERNIYIRKGRLVKYIPANKKKVQS